jgi:hypothetical protein
VLATFEAASFDAFVDDPPAGIAFMGRAWDDYRNYEPRTRAGLAVFATFGGVAADALEAAGHHDMAVAMRETQLAPWAVGFLAFMTEVSVAKLRVAKPGAHSLSWALPRTSDLTMMAMRLAGWDIRDTITHLCGQGMGIDKLHGAEREVVGKRVYAGGHVQNSTESIGFGGCDPEADTRMATAPATDDARKWAGWHTTLSPAAEYWILARAPMALTVARNVLEHGTGAINIGATRTPTDADEREAMRARSWTQGGGIGRGDVYGDGAANESGPSSGGRWPKNAVISCALACDGDRHSPGCPRRMLDEMSGASPSNWRAEKGRGLNESATFGSGSHEPRGPAGHGDSGGASRYFPTFGYHPKASDRSIPGRSDISNTHPTIKNPALMRWLIRLVTPPGGRVLDCFMGSGTTGVACAAEAVDFTGVEADPTNFEIARSRILAATGSPEAALEHNRVAPNGSQLNLL